MSDYPGSIFSPRAVADRAGVSYDADKTKVFFAKDHNDFGNEIVAIENALGINPAGADDWRPAGETWTYASATTFTITGDKTSKYQKGDKLKLTNGTVKYPTIESVSYSSPNTTITIEDDVELVDAAITSPHYSKAESPQGFVKKNYVCCAYQTSAQSIPHATWTKVSLPNEDFDPENCFDTANYKWTCPKSGYYSIYGMVSLDQYAGRGVMGIYKNGSILFKGVDGDFNNDYRTLNASAIRYLEKGDYLELYVYQNSGDAVDTAAAIDSRNTSLSIAKINP